LVGVAGVHPGEQRSDKTLEHLIAESGPYEPAHGLIVGPIGIRTGGTIDPLGAIEIERGPCHTVGADDPRCGEGVEIGRHAEDETARKAMECAVRPYPRARTDRRGEQMIETDFTAQVNGIGYPGEKGVCPAVDGVSGEFA
jgi:hypothetical protein